MSRSRIPGGIARPHAVGFTKGAIDGFALSWVDVSTVQIGTGVARDSADAYNIELTSTQNVAITGGTGINKLDTGTEANSWYAVWVVSGPSGTGGLLSTSATSPTLPAGYDVSKRRIGWVYNHSDNDIQGFLQTGTGRDRTLWHNETITDYTKILDAATSNGVWSGAVDCSSRVPTTAHTMMALAYSVSGSANAGRIKPTDFLASVSDTGSTFSATAQSQSKFENFEMPCVTNKSFKYYSDNTSNDLTVLIQGWKETL